MPLGPAQKAATEDCSVAPTRGSCMEHRQWLTSASVPFPRAPRTNIPGMWPHPTTEQHPISFTNGAPKGWSPQATEAHRGKSHSRGLAPRTAASPHSQ